MGKTCNLVIMLCKSGNPVCQKTFQNAFIRLVVLENVGKATKIKLLSLLNQSYADNYKLWRKPTICQPCCTNLAPLLVVHYSKSFHSILPSRKYRSSNKTHVPRSIRTKVMQKALKSSEPSIGCVTDKNYNSI